jgi:glycosyltransferase involved in cell wall biosynthesis
MESGDRAVSVLRIGVDARELLGQSTGVGVYLAELLRRWTARADAASRRVVLSAPQRIPLPLSSQKIEQRLLGRGRGTWWEQTALRRAVRREPLDVFFAPAYTAPLGLRLPLAVTIHDLSFAAHPEWFRWREGLRRRWLTARAARSAAVVFTDSEFSRRELETRLGVPSGRIRLVSPGVTPRARGPRQPSPLVLYVGSLFNRRRLPDLIEAFTRATPDLPDARLVIVGADRTWPRQDLPAVARRLGVADRVDIRSYADDAEVSTLYARAAVFAFLSEYEGFGLTPLEALAGGVPIVVLDTPVAREVYGPAATYVDPADAVAGAAAAIRDLLTDGGRASQTLMHASAVLSRYSWERAADTTLLEIERVAGRPAGRRP